MSSSAVKFGSIKGALISIFTVAMFSCEAPPSSPTFTAFSSRSTILTVPSFFAAIAAFIDFGSIISQSII
jgi:hypothetical protein